MRNLARYFKRVPFKNSQTEQKNEPSQEDKAVVTGSRQKGQRQIGTAKQG